jgi:hypothetical protein
MRFNKSVEGCRALLKERKTFVTGLMVLALRGRGPSEYCVMAAWAEASGLQYHRGLA